MSPPEGGGDINIKRGSNLFKNLKEECNHYIKCSTMLKVRPHSTICLLRVIIHNDVNKNVVKK